MPTGLSFPSGQRQTIPYDDENNREGPRGSIWRAWYKVQEPLKPGEENAEPHTPHSAPNEMQKKKENDHFQALVVLLRVFGGPGVGNSAFLCSGVCVSITGLRNPTQDPSCPQPERCLFKPHPGSEVRKTECLVKYGGGSKFSHEPCKKTAHIPGKPTNLVDMVGWGTGAFPLCSERVGGESLGQVRVWSAFPFLVAEGWKRGRESPTIQSGGVLQHFPQMSGGDA